MASQHPHPEDTEKRQQHSFSLIFDLKYQLTQYASHHNNPVNIGIHMIGIPLIVWSALVFGAKTGPLLAVPAVSATPCSSLTALRARLFQVFPPNFSVLLMVAYCAYYIKLDKVAGLVATPLFMGAAKNATSFLARHPQDASRIATGVQIFAWTAQFIGHGVYEKRAPKLFDNLLQAFVLGPYFVVYEVLFYMGYRPKLKRALDRLVEKDIREWKAKKALQAEQVQRKNSQQ